MVLAERSSWAGDSTHGLEPDLADPATSCNMSPAGSSSWINPGNAQPCQTTIHATSRKVAGTVISSIGYDLSDSTAGYAYRVRATTLTQGYFQPSDPTGPPNKNNTNPCTNTTTRDHREVPTITSYTTLQAIASPGDLYKKP
jgi:hypothetical protein